jgi:hypothetical protein
MGQQQSLERPLPRIPHLSEEDECPVCHRELPSRALPDYEALRANHVSQCIESQIALHSSSLSRPGAYTSASQLPPITRTSSSDTSRIPLPRPAGTAVDNAPRASSNTTYNTPTAMPYRQLSTRSSPRPSTSTTIPNTPEARAAAREEAHAAVVFRATQSPTPEQNRRSGMFPYKATEKDCIDDAECTICLEEFEVGVDMARLECLCRFHLKCIREWFVDHPGRCPVHQHDGYGY